MIYYRSKIFKHDILKKSLKALKAITKNIVNEKPKYIKNRVIKVNEKFFT